MGKRALSRGAVEEREYSVTVNFTASEMLAIDEWGKAHRIEGFREQYIRALCAMALDVQRSADDVDEAYYGHLRRRKTLKP